MANNDDWDIDDVDENGELEEDEEAPEYDEDEYDDELDDDTPDEVKNFNPADHIKIIKQSNPAGKFLIKLILIITLVVLIVTPFIIPQKMPTPIRKFVYKTEDCVKTGVNYTVYYAKFAFSKFVGTNLDAKLPKKVNFAQKNTNIKQDIKSKNEPSISQVSTTKNENIQKDEIVDENIEDEKIIEKVEVQKEETQQNNVDTTKPTRVFNLSGSGKLKDLNTTAKIRPELKKMLIQNDIYTFDQLPKIRPFLKDFIFAWTNGRTEEEVAEIIDADYKKFETKKMVEILTFTTFKRAGLVPSYNTNYVEQSPSDISSTFYVNLAPIIENISTVEEKIKYVEPCSTFLLKRCKGDENCLVSWDLLIEMLGLYDQKDNLKKFAE